MSQHSELILFVREKLGLSRKEVADALGLGLDGMRHVASWERGEEAPPRKLFRKIELLASPEPFARNPAVKPAFKFIDLFAGIGGIRIPFQQLGGACVFTSEWDRFAQKTYKANFGELPHGDITKITSSDIPQHDILLGGFPCQAFSQAGLKQGFSDTRGTLFFEIQKILVAKRPKAFLLENVKQLRGHDKGRTLKTIIEVLEGRDTISPSKAGSLKMSEEAKSALDSRLNYYVTWKVLASNDFGVPQKRERIYLVGFDRDQFPADFDFEAAFKFPEPSGQKTSVGSILENHSRLDPRYTLSDRLWTGHKNRKAEHERKGNGFGYGLFNKKSSHTNTISARYYKDGSEILIDQSEIGRNPRKLTPRECARLQGFPEEFVIPVSDSQAYKQFGNSVAVPVIRAIAEEMMVTLGCSKRKGRRTDSN
ncbi:MAG: DNA (cytosine-5-)-methyltransferase [Proteobacteria bacterium]|nr:DNA (cytosine-5-)-methyltransferase [Pseudomonadota bacterium]